MGVFSRKSRRARRRAGRGRPCSNGHCGDRRAATGARRETRPCHPWQVARRQLLQQQRRALATTVIRPVGEWGAETGLPGPDPAGTRALENFVSGMPASFCTDIAYRLAAFQQADVDNSKTVDLAELQTLLLELHPAAQPEDAAGLLAAADENGDGVLQVGEFMRLFENSYATTMCERNEDRHD